MDLGTILSGSLCIQALARYVGAVLVLHHFGAQCDCGIMRHVTKPTPNMAFSASFWPLRRNIPACPIIVAAQSARQGLQHRRRSASHVVSAERQTMETPKAPGSESNFTGLPANRDEIPVTTPISSEHMKVHATAGNMILCEETAAVRLIIGVCT